VALFLGEQLLQAFERGWVPEKKFTEELQKLIF
jgi:hypothetical protein